MLTVLRLSSIIVSHFFLNLRQAVHDIHEDPFVNSRPSFVRSEHSSLRFESFVGNMGEELVHGRDPPACDMTWPDNGSVEDDHDISLFRSQPMLMTHVASGNGFDNTNIEEMSTVGTAARAIHT
ncbi:hypothetical protein OBBRIDRAFT_406064 [Obba rivulosa]|uniref:Uncharacterized protein n=1 Tax=Obba rivulosa TaxID=1052685 RepID=A0A8E2AHB2_9APHY|nr:hypothetical protein OBBRIDRAFT_406064 [Obba rivulosa]